MMGLGPSCPLGVENLKEPNIPSNFVLDEDSKPFDDPNCGSFARKTLRHANLLEAKSIDCMASNPICYPYLQEMSLGQLDLLLFWLTPTNGKSPGNNSLEPPKVLSSPLYRGLFYYVSIFLGRSNNTPPPPPQTSSIAPLSIFLRNTSVGLVA
jgi:hypothetical protein